jgi:hypothetical protein
MISVIVTISPRDYYRYDNFEISIADDLSTEFGQRHSDNLYLLDCLYRHNYYN